MLDLTGKVALVTGGSRGVGRAIALRLAEAGADIVLNFVNARTQADHTAEAIAALGRRVGEVQADLSEPADIRVMLDWIGETFGRLDILVTSAAAADAGSLLDVTPERFERTMNTNVRGLMLLVQSSLPLLQKAERPAKVIALSSPLADFAGPSAGLRGASQAALESTIRHLALELGPRGVNLNAIQAGPLDTEATGLLTGPRTLAADDVANAVLFLASSLSDMIQGQTLTVDGGATVRV